MQKRGKARRRQDSEDESIIANAKAGSHGRNNASAHASASLTSGNKKTRWKSTQPELPQEFLLHFRVKIDKLPRRLVCVKNFASGQISLRHSTNVVLPVEIPSVILIAATLFPTTRECSHSQGHVRSHHFFLPGAGASAASIRLARVASVAIVTVTVMPCFKSAAVARSPFTLISVN